MKESPPELAYPRQAIELAQAAPNLPPAVASSREPSAGPRGRLGAADVEDEPLIIYADDRKAVLVTTNRDFAFMAKRMQPASVIWPSVLEINAVTAMDTALEWLRGNQLPDGRVLRVKKDAGDLVAATNEEETEARGAAVEALVSGGPRKVRRTFQNTHNQPTFAIGNKAGQAQQS